MMAASVLYRLATALILLVTLVLGKEDLHVQQRDEQHHVEEEGHQVGTSTLISCPERKKKCTKAGGTCQLKEDTCEGETYGRFCKGSTCTCCLPSKPQSCVEKKKKCTKVGGTCQSKKITCLGKTYGKFCKGGACTCCLPSEAVCDSTCENGGTCSAPNTCTCTDSWTGTTCEMPVCDSPCMNGGTCLAQSGSEPHKCSCADTWAGPTCEIAVCDSPCMNGGTCLAQSGSEPHKCSCADTWTGPTCEIAVCDSPCLNGGTCLAHHGSENHCTCTVSWTGLTCEIPVCDSTCMNGGICIAHSGSEPHSCKCTDSWTGSTCVIPVCDSPCMNGGSCLAHYGEPHHCICTDSWTGPTCESEIQKEVCQEDQGFFKLPGSNQCMKAFLDQKRLWTQADAKCTSEGLAFAKPDDSLMLRNYLNENYGSNNRYWLGAKGTGSGIEWQDGQELSSSNALWYPGNPTERISTAYCLALTATTSDMSGHYGRPYYSTLCTDDRNYAICEVIMD